MQARSPELGEENRAFATIPFSTRKHARAVYSGSGQRVTEFHGNLLHTDRCAYLDAATRRMVSLNHASLARTSVSCTSHWACSPLCCCW